MSIRFIHSGDFHYDSKNKEQCIKNGKAIESAIKKYNVDFMVDAGDFTNRSHYASDKDGLSELQGIMKGFTDLCPVMGVYGTRSHNPKGSMSIFPDFNVLEPGKVYGNSGYDDDNIRELTSSGHGPVDYVLFGIPEIDKNNIMKSIPNITSEEANSKAAELYIEYVENFIAPMRLKYKDVPAILVAHGNFSDSLKEISNDIIMKSSDIVIHTEKLMCADLTYLAAGHIHKPHNFKHVTGGYVGGTGSNWNEVDFLPCFNLVEIDDSMEVKVTRIPYGNPMRKKVIPENTDWQPDIAYKIVTDDKDYVLPENIHEWSIIEHLPVKNETQRVTAEQAEDAKKLSDWFKLIDPEFDKTMIPKIDSIPMSRNETLKKDLSVKMKYGKISGSVLFATGGVEFDIENLPQTLVNLDGGNGTGKSSTLGSICHPFPIIIGKQTLDKKRPVPALKDFFNQQGAGIRKLIDVNGVEHEHIINIKAAHTQNPSVECYLNIAGVPVLTLNTWDEMFEKCEELYGSFKDYLITTFNVQPQQSNKNENLMNAKMTDIQSIVQNIAGIDYSDQKQFALDTVNGLKNEINLLKVKVNLMQENLGDKSLTDVMIHTKKNELKAITIELAETLTTGKTLKAELEKLVEKQNQNNNNKAEKLRLSSDNTFSCEKRITLNNELSELTELIEELALFEKIVEDHDHNQNRITELEKEQNLVDSHNNLMTADYNEKSQAWLKVQYDIKSNNDNRKNDIEGIESLININLEKIKALETPCEFCGKTPSDNQTKINDIEKVISEHSEKHAEAVDIEIQVIPPEPKEPTLKTFNAHELNNLKGKEFIDITEVKANIQKAKTGQQRIIEIKSELSNIEKSIKHNKSEIEKIIIDTEIDQKVRAVTQEKDLLLSDYHNKSKESVKIESEIKALKEKLDTIEIEKLAIKDETTHLKTLSADNKHWTYISKMLSPNKIPALELELIIADIDSAATKNLESFLDGRYSIKTVTQVEGKKATKDAFDIMIHDKVSGKEKSFMKWSPGERSFPADAYVKGLVKKRIQRSNVVYSPIVLDEIDGPICTEWISMFYTMQYAFYKDFDNTVLVVTHQPESKQFIDHTVDAESLRVVSDEN